MKKVKLVIVIALVAMIFSSCATICGGKITQYQKTKPTAGQPKREIRVAAFIFDCITAPIVTLPVDFIDGAIYKPKEGGR